jgi:hypothetical protein
MRLVKLDDETVFHVVKSIWRKFLSGEDVLSSDYSSSDLAEMLAKAQLVSSFEGVKMDPLMWTRIDLPEEMLEEVADPDEEWHEVWYEKSRAAEDRLRTILLEQLEGIQAS